MAKTRRKYKGNATATTIAAGLAAGASTATIAASTGWPTSGPFYAVVDPGLSTEEKIYVGTISGTSLSNITRGADDTSDQTHSSGCAIYPVFTAIDADEANELTSKYGARGSIVYQGASTFEELVKGTQGYPLVIGANDPSWAQLSDTGLATGAVTEAKIASSAVTADKIGSGAVVEAKLGSGSVTEAKIGSGAVTEAKLASGAVTAAKIGTGAVVEAKIGDGAVTSAKLGTGAVVAGTIASGAVSSSNIEAGAVDTNALADGSVTVAKLGLTEVKLRRVANQSIANGATTAISWDTEDADTAGFITATSDTLTVPSGLTGLYVIGGSMTSSAGSGEQTVRLLVNGITIESQAFSSTTNDVRFGDTVYLVAADTVQVSVNNASTSSKNYTGRLWMTRIMD